jgi:hypothetical protein
MRIVADGASDVATCEEAQLYRYMVSETILAIPQASRTEG